jgi:hypothetical protein
MNYLSLFSFNKDPLAENKLKILKEFHLMKKKTLC